MIQVLNFPAEGRYLLDGNNTQITVTSSNGAGYYFRAKIYIDDVLFDEQGWSRKDNFTATKDLIYLYHAYFKPYFLGDFTSGLLEQTNFKKKVTIVIEERLIATDALVDDVTLPNFYLMYNVKSETYNDTSKIHVLGLNSEVLKVKKTGVIVIPFYANATTENVKVTIKDDLDNTLNVEEITSVTGKKVFIYTLNLEDITVVSGLLYLKATIEVGAQTVEKLYKILRLPNYEVKEIVYQNNYGFYIPAYFDGDFEDKRGFNVNSYENANNSETVFSVDETGTYTINTGGLSIKEKEVVREVANSLDCYFKNNGVYIAVNTNIKKATYEKSRLNIFSEDLVFTFRAGLPFKNGLISEIVDPELVITSLTTADNLNFAVAFTSNFTYLQLFYQLRLNSSQAWSVPYEFAGLTSPQNAITSFGNSVFQLRILASYNATIVYSNIVEFTDVITDVITMPDINPFSVSKSFQDISSQVTASKAFTEAVLFNGYVNTLSLAYSKIRIISLPGRGTITQNGLSIIVPVIVSLADIQAGNLAFWPTGIAGNETFENYVEYFNYVVIDTANNESATVECSINFNTL